MSDEPNIKIKTHKSRDPFLRLPSKTVKDARIGWRTLGMLAYMLDLPPDWKFRLSHIAKTRPGHGNGKAAASAVIKELQEIGYLHIEVRREGGRIKENVWHVADRPIFKPAEEGKFSPGSEFQDEANRGEGIEDVGNRPLHTTDKTHYRTKTESRVAKGDARHSGRSRIGKRKRHYEIDGVTNVYYEPGNLDDVRALEEIRGFPLDLIRRAVERVASHDDLNRAFPSATLRGLNKMRQGSSGDVQAWAMVEENSPVEAMDGACLDGDFEEEK